MKKENTRLSIEIIPNSYKIEIEPSEDMQKYNGKIEIKATVNKPTKEITLHSKELEIKNATICVGTQCLLPNLKNNSKTETVILQNLKPIPKGDIEIHIGFNGKISNSLTGIYLSKYEHKGKTENIITTQCEAPYARKIFPCFDEPDKKAVFDISVLINKKLSAISNMPIKSETVEKDKKRINFDTTPKMPTYLFYLGIGNFESIEDTYNQVKLRVITTPGKSKKGEFALNLAKKYLEYFERYSEIPYPLKKLDLLAIPDFSAGAMENWGAITFRELQLLADEKTSARIKKRIAEVVAHELWHQWSGNLVTMRWWNDLWLNESFANYMAYKVVAHFNPEWNMWEDYLINEYSRGLSKDTLKSTHPIEVEVSSVNEIEEIFDDISYAKGGSILRMLEAYVGEEQFRLGVSNYLKENAYSNAEAHDLWEAIGKVSNSKIKELMKSWISQEGYPLLRINKTQNGIQLKQERCNKKTTQLWPIPISIFTDNTCHNKFLDKKEENYQIDSKYIKLNHEQYGFYRTKYEKDMLGSLGNLVQEKKLGVSDRYGLNNDLWALVSIGEEKVTDYLDFIEYYSNEDNYIILSEIASNIRKLDRLYFEEDWWNRKLEQLKKKLMPVYKRILDRVGWNEQANETMENNLLRALTISFCGFLGDKETIIEAQSRYARKEISMNIADAVYYIIARNGEESTFKEMLQRFKESKEVEQRVRLLMGLYQFKQPKIIEKALDFAFSTEVRMQDLSYIFGNLISNPNIRQVLVKWAKNNWQKLKPIQETHHVFSNILNALIVSQITKESKKEIQKFLEEQKVAYKLTKANAFEIVDLNINLIEKNRKDLVKQ